MSDKNTTNATSSADNGASINESQEEQKKKKDFFPMFPMMLLWFSIGFSMAVYYTREGGSLGALYFGMAVLPVIILVHVIPGIGCVISGYKIRKQIKYEYGLVDYRRLKRDLKEDKYYIFFTGVSLCSLVIVCVYGFIVYSILLVLGDEAFLSDLFEFPSMACYFVTDFFTMDTEQVTYIDESKYIYYRSGKRISSDIYSYYVVNFQTSGGELLSLIVDRDNLAEVRSYNNTEIKYIPRTGVYVP